MRKEVELVDLFKDRTEEGGDSARVLHLTRRGQTSLEEQNFTCRGRKQMLNEIICLIYGTDYKTIEEPIRSRNIF